MLIKEIDSKNHFDVVYLLQIFITKQLKICVLTSEYTKLVCKTNLS